MIKLLLLNKPSAMDVLQTTLPNKVYYNVKSEVNTILDSTYYLNFITDESTNINKERIINLWINTAHEIFYFVSQAVGTVSINTTNTAAWLIKHLDGVVTAIGQELTASQLILIVQCVEFGKFWN